MNNREKTRREESIHIDTYNICFDTIWKNEKEKKEIYDSYYNNLHSKYLIRKWRMAHFVGCHQWVFSNFQQKQHKVNTQVK